MDALYVVGAPGVGKSTLMANLTRQFAHLPEQRLRRQLIGVPLVDRHQGEIVGFELGRHREKFSGTDALGMAVAPDAVSWVRESPGLPDLRWLLAEGQRLAIASFFEALRTRATRFVVAHLAVSDPRTLDDRCLARGSNQSEQWRKGAMTKAVRSAGIAQQLGAEVILVDADQPPELVHERVAERFFG